MLRGSQFYEDESVRTMYLAHRHSGALSPNVVMEEPAFLAAAGLLGGMSVADLGCGDGANAKTIMDLGAATYIGVDGSAGMVEIARERQPVSGVSFAHEDIEDVNLGDQAFDLVISRMAFTTSSHWVPIWVASGRRSVPGAASSSLFATP